MQICLKMPLTCHSGFPALHFQTSYLFFIYVYMICCPHLGCWLCIIFMNNSHSQCLVTTESTSPAFMCSTKSTRSPLRNSTSSTRFPTVSPSQLTTAGTSMTCWKRCGTIYSLCACKSCLYSHHRGAKNSWLFKWCRKRSEIHMLFQTAEFDWFHVLIFSYTKPKGQLPDYTSPVVLPDGRTSVEDFCLKIHKNLIKELK